MNIKDKRSRISDYDFLKLLLSSFVLQKDNLVIENHQLEKDLFTFYNRNEYHLFFENLHKKEDANGNKFVDLSYAFETAYAFGLVLQISDNFDSKESMINCTYEDAVKIQFEYDPKIVLMATDLCNEILIQNTMHK